MDYDTKNRDYTWAKSKQTVDGSDARIIFCEDKDDWI